MGLVLGPQPVRQGGEPGRAHLPRHRPARDPRRHRLHRRCAATSPTPTWPATRARCCRPTARRTPASPTPRRRASARSRTTRSTSARHFVDDVASVSGARIEVEELAWERISVDGREHDHSWVRRGPEVRTTVVTVDGTGDDQQAWVVSGLKDLTLLKSTGSEFHGFLKDELHDPARDPRPGDGHVPRGALALRPARRRLGRDVRRRARDPAADLRHRALPGPAADALRDGPGGARRRTRRSPRSASRRPTSTTSWSTCSRSAWTTPARCSSPPTAPTA